MRHTRLILTAFLILLTFSSCYREQPKLNILVHRGLCSTGSEFTTDENTLDALKRAQEACVDGVEFDVHLTADDSLVIRHDNKITEGLSCQESNFEDIRAWVLPFGNQIPTLHEWLVQAKKTPEIKMMLEIKAHPEDREKLLVRKCLDEIRALDMTGQVSILSFKAETLDEVLRLEPSIKAVLNSSSLHHSLAPEEVKAHGFSAASYRMDVFLNHPEWITRCKELGLETFFWMVDSAYLKDLAEDLGCSWITTDYYDIVKY